MTKLYWADVRALEEEACFRRFYARVPADRRAKIDGLRFPADKARSLGAWLLLEYALKEGGISGPTEISRNEYGKPFLKNCPQVHFSLSHSGHLALCAVSDGEVGCDIQHMENRNPALAERFFSPAETAWLSTLPRQAQKAGFYRLWTLKESFVKAVGLGLSLPLKDFSVLPGEEIRLQQTRFPDREFFFREWALGEDYRCACCAGSPEIPSPEPVKLV